MWAAAGTRSSGPGYGASATTPTSTAHTAGLAGGSRPATSSVQRRGRLCWPNCPRPPFPWGSPRRISTPSPRRCFPNPTSRRHPSLYPNSCLHRHLPPVFLHIPMPRRSPSRQPRCTAPVSCPITSTSASPPEHPPVPLQWRACIPLSCFLCSPALRSGHIIFLLAHTQRLLQGLVPRRRPLFAHPVTSAPSYSIYPSFAIPRRQDLLAHMWRPFQQQTGPSPVTAFALVTAITSPLADPSRSPTLCDVVDGLIQSVVDEK
jgi:hypothetical protein